MPGPTQKAAAGQMREGGELTETGLLVSLLGKKERGLTNALRKQAVTSAYVDSCYNGEILCGHVRWQ